MGNLKEISEIVWKQIGGGSDESRIELEEIEARARYEYANQMLLLAWKEKRDEGMYLVPSEILSEVKKEVKNNEIDISDLGIIRSLPMEVWLQSIGGIGCKCRYIKSTLNHSKILCAEDSLSEDDKTFYVVGNKIKFPQGAHAKELDIIYANDGEDLDTQQTYVSEAVGALVMQKLAEIYLGKIIPADTTNNSTPNT